MHEILQAVAQKAFDESAIARFRGELWGCRVESTGILLFDDGVHSGVATTPLVIDDISAEIVAHVGWMNADLPVGQVYLRHHQEDGLQGWTVTYCFKALNTWLDQNGQGVLQMMLDMVGNAAAESQWVVAQLTPLGMNPTDQSAENYFALVLSTV